MIHQLVPKLEAVGSQAECTRGEGATGALPKINHQ